MQYLCDELQRVGERVVKRLPCEYDLLINVPPSTSKSTIISQMFPAWLWCLDDSLKVITGSYEGSLAVFHAVKSRDIIRSEKYKKYFPHVKLKSDQDNKKHYETVNGGMRVTCSVTGSITGKHAHILIIDDAHDPRRAASKVELQNATNWMNETLPSRAISLDNTPTILLMQRLHKEDAAQNMIDTSERLKHINLPAKLDDSVKPKELKSNYVDGLLDVNRLSSKALEQLNKRLGSYAFAGQYMQRPSKKGGNAVKESWFGSIDERAFYELVAGNKITWDILIDGALTDNKANDPTGTLVYTYFQNTLYIRNFTSVWKKTPDYIRYLKTQYENFGCDNRSLVEIEPKQNGLTIVDTLRIETKFNVRPFIFPKISNIRQNESKEQRLTGCLPFIEGGRVVLIGGVWNKSFIEDVCEFPNAEHDEAVDLLVMAITARYHKRSAFVVTS